MTRMLDGAISDELMGFASSDMTHCMFHILVSVNDVIDIGCTQMEVDGTFFRHTAAFMPLPK